MGPPPCFLFCLVFFSAPSSPPCFRWESEPCFLHLLISMSVYGQLLSLLVELARQLMLGRHFVSTSRRQAIKGPHEQVSRFVAVLNFNEVVPGLALFLGLTPCVSGFGAS